MALGEEMPEHSSQADGARQRKTPWPICSAQGGSALQRRLQGRFSLFQRLGGHRLLMVKAASDADSRRDNDGASHEDTHVGPPSLESQGTTIERTPDKLVAQVQHLDFEILQMPGVALRFGVLLGEPYERIQNAEAWANKCATLAS